MDHHRHVCFVGPTPSVIIFAMFCRSLFVLLVIVLSVLRFTDSDYPFGIFKLFIQTLLMIIKRVLSSAGFRQPVASLCLSSAIAMLSRKRYDKSILITCVMWPDILSNLFSNESGKRQSTFIVFKLSKYTKITLYLNMHGLQPVVIGTEHFNYWPKLNIHRHLV
jgi:hypothetical protein